MPTRVLLMMAIAGALLFLLGAVFVEAMCRRRTGMVRMFGREVGRHHMVSAGALGVMVGLCLVIPGFGVLFLIGLKDLASHSPRLLVAVLGAVGGLLLAMYLIIAGWRGRQLDRHPVCRSCRYDLHGLAAQPDLCPECGVTLTSPLAIAIGNRVRRGRMLVAGLILGGGLIASILLSMSGALETPAWWLRRQVATGADAETGLAATELVERVDAGVLDEGALLSVVETLLARQGNTEMAWPESYSRLIERCWAANQLTPEQVNTYFRQGIEPGVVISMRKRLRSGEPIMLGIEQEPVFRVSPDLQQVMGAMLALNLKRITLNGAPIEFEPRTYTHLHLGPRHGIKGGGGDWLDLPIEPGWYMLGLEFDMLITPYGQPDPQFALHSWTYTSVHEISVVGPGESVVGLIVDPSLEPAIRASIRRGVNDAGLMVMVGETLLRWSDPVSFRNPPVALAFEIVGRAGNTERTLGHVACRAGGRGTLNLPEEPAVLFPGAERIDLIFRPKPELAERAFDIDAVWGGELVWRDIAIRPTPFEDLHPEVRAGVFAESFYCSGTGRFTSGSTLDRLVLNLKSSGLPAAGAWTAMWQRADGTEVAIGRTWGHTGEKVTLGLEFTDVTPGEQFAVILRPLPIEESRHLGVAEEIWFTEPVPLILVVE